MEVSEASNNQEKKGEPKIVIKSQGRLFVHLLHDYFSKENTNKGPLKSVRKVNERVADALQISTKSITRILKEMKRGELVTPGKKRPRQSPKSDVGSLDETAIRNHIYQYYEQKEWPTRIKLVESLNTANLFHGQRSTLSIILKNLDFKWKMINKRQCLFERRDIVTSRCLFLREIQECDLEKVIFLDETWMNAGHSSDDSLKSPRKVPRAKGGRLILAHAGNAQGFIPECCLLFRSEKTEDFNQDMTAAVFKKWFVSLLDKVPSNSIIVMDDAPYHSVLKDKIPTISWKKQEIQDWLTKINVEWSTSMLKGELMDLVYLNKPRTKTYVIDELAKEKGCRVIRIPPHHSQFNPIEIIWSQIKGYVAHENKTFKLSDVENLTKMALESITGEDWKRCVQHTAQTIEEAWKKEAILEYMLEQICEDSLNSMTDTETDSDESSDEDRLES